MASSTNPGPQRDGRRDRARIALLVQDLGGGGAERMIVNLAGGLAGRGHEVEIVTIREEGPFLAHVPANVPVVTLGTRRVSRSIPALARYLRVNRPDAALSTLTHMNVAAVLARALARAPTRLVLREASSIHESAEAETAPLLRLSYRLLRWVYPWADHVIAVSEAVAKEGREVTALPDDRVTAVRNPVLTSRDLFAIRASEVAPNSWLEDHTVPVILAVGRLTPAKDYVTLLGAFARLLSVREARLVILGEGALRESLTEHARSLGIADSVLFAGFTKHPFAWMKHAALLAHSARWEGSPNVLVEALACGLPVVATDCPGGSSEILEAGQYGRLVPVGDVDAFAQALAAALDGPHDAERLRLRASAFTVDAVVPTYESILLGDPGDRSHQPVGS
jgi:glycosyltransferase involved in cell wall biosynthesis